MSWNELLIGDRAELHTTSKQELVDLRAAIDRNLRDAAIGGLSAHNRFGLAYEAGLLVAKMVIACAGYRVKGQGAHVTTFTGLEFAMGPTIGRIARYLNRCRRKRNEISDDMAGVASDTEATEILREVEGFREAAEAWIAANYPALA
jgi:hypothetical protein